MANQRPPRRGRDRDGRKGSGRPTHGRSSGSRPSGSSGNRPGGPGKKPGGPGGNKPAGPRQRSDRKELKDTSLPEGWSSELRNTARAHRLESVTSEINEAIEAYQAGNYEDAATLAERAKNEAPRSGRIRELLGLSYYRSGRWHDALRELLTYRRLTGRKDQNHLIADCYRADERIDKALHTINEVSQNEVPLEIWSELLIVAASTIAESGDISRALAQLARTDLKPRKVEPYHLRLWYVRADLLEKAGRSAEARREWETIAAEDPTFFDVADRLARTT
jgi:tetratricopeptide (TPR) repeat protein